ncbi:MAG: family N-acetyltransferase [Rhodospirillales bacterium]|nr:family N-acetyltransferase [Rhodospirillales bacterium]
MEQAPGPEEIVTLPDGSCIRLRAVHPGDEAHLQDLVAHMTPADLRRRFFAPVRELGSALAHRLANPNPTHDVALAAMPLDGERFLGVGRLSGARGIAEFAVAVSSDAQGRGIGYLLMGRLIERARLLGLATVEGEVLRDNDRMLRLCRKLGFTTSGHPSDAAILRVTKRLSVVPQ